MPSVVSALCRYPLKSGASEVLSDGRITERGLELDREFMVTKIADGAERLCTQRDRGKEQLARIRLRVGESHLTLSAPGIEELRLPAAPIDKQARSVMVHRQLAEGIDQGDSAAIWLTEYLGDFEGKPHRLVRQNEDFVRRPNQAFVTRADARTAFADGYPVLLVNDESLRAVLGRMQESGTSTSLESLRERVRGNVYVSTLGEPFLEDRIKRIRIGDVVLELVKPCSRCSVVAVNQSSGLRDNEGRAFMAALAEMRRGTSTDLGAFFPALEPAELNQTFMGMNAVVVARGSGSVRVADEVEILEMSSRR